MNKNFIANLHVDKRIVELLSKSTYQKSFASAIKELVSNAYDADALSVTVNISADYNSITIEDDGNGMSEFEFNKYLTIAGTKYTLDLTRRYKRKRIGQFGVGFLAIFPFCEALEIITTVENSEEILIARIPTIEYTQASKNQLIEEIQIPCKIIEDKGQKQKHYTKITFIKPNYSVHQYFEIVETRKRESILNLNPFDKFVWELQEDLPISYNPDGKSFSKISYEEPIGINVYINGKPIFRNELQDIILEKNTIDFSGINCTYIFTTNYKSIRPIEARGIKRRVNNVGIGSRTDFELRIDRGFSRLHWISGEIYYSEQIKEHLTLSRGSFVSTPIVDELNDFFAEKLKDWAYYIENIAVAEKTIEQSIHDSKKGNVTPKEEVLTSNLKKLTDRGFKIIREELNESKYDKEQQISFDKEEKTVTIFNTTQLFKDYLFVNGRNIEIQYKSEGFEESDIPCKFVSPDLFELNQNYPLFKSKSYGNLFKKLHVFLVLAQRENITSKEMYKFVIDNFLKEFEQYK